LGVSSVMVTIYFYVDTLLLRPMQGEASVGYYNAAYRILAFSIMVPVLFNQVIFPILSRFSYIDYQKNPTLKRIFRRTVLYMAVSGIPVATALYFLATPVLTLVCGDNYARSSDCLRILSLAICSIFLTYPHISMLIASGKQMLFALIAGFSGIFNVILNLILIPKYSFEGAAWATFFTETAVLVCAIVCVRKYTGLTAVHREAFKVIPVAVGVGLTSFLMSEVTLYITIPMVGIIFIGLLFAVKLLPFDIRDEINEDRD